MIKRALVTFVLLFVPAFTSVLARAQTITTTADACGGKANQACYNIPSRYPGNVAGFISIDNREGSTVPLQYNFYLGAYANNGVHGTYDGFVANPDGTRNPFNGVASFVSDDGTLEASFSFYAYYVKTCSGRGCGGTLGWHYKILSGSTVTVQ